MSFYVTVKNGDRVGYLLGPYERHEQALANVERGQKLAETADRWAHFYAYGTARTEAAVKTIFGPLWAGS